MTAVTATVAEVFGIAEHRVHEPRPGEVAIEVRAEDLPAYADAAVAGLDARLLSLFAADERATRGRFVVRQVWSLPRLGTFLCISAPVYPRDEPIHQNSPRITLENHSRRCVLTTRVTPTPGRQLAELSSASAVPHKAD